MGHWVNDPNFEKLSNFEHTVKVTNDLAERSVKLMQNFSGAITKSEEGKQSLFQVVEDHRPGSKF